MSLKAETSRTPETSLTPDMLWADQVWREGLEPDPYLSVSEWADEHRVLSSVASAEPGRWRTDRTPYMREIMDCLSPASSVERVVFMKGAQIGGSETGNSFCGFVIHHAPGPMLLVQPTVEGAKRYSKTRIDPMIETTPVLRERVSEARSRDSGNTQLQKRFPGGMLTLTGANSAVGLRSMPIRYLFLDEVDGYPGDADGEGDPVDLAVKRTATFVRRKILLVSTPTLKGYSRIEDAFEASDKRRYQVPCQSCGSFAEITWTQIKWPKGMRERAAYVCSTCGHSHSEGDKQALLANGKWIAEGNFDGKVAGFHLSALYSPWMTWAEVALEHKAVKDDPTRLQVWTNTVLGQPWEDQAGEALDPAVLMARREDFESRLAESVAAITIGVDVQDDRLEYEVVAWGHEEESWSLAYEVIFGDPSSPKLWAKLDKVIKTKWVHAREIPDLRAHAITVDMGGHYSDAVLEYAYRRRHIPVWAIKGASDLIAPVWPAQFSRSNKHRRPLYVVGVNRAKDVVAQRLKLDKAGPGYCHIRRDRGQDWFEQITNEVVRTRYKMGRPIRYWQPKRDGDPVEALDCRVYAYAALKGLERQRRLNLKERVAWIREQALKPQSEQTQSGESVEASGKLEEENSSPTVPTAQARRKTRKQQRRSVRSSYLN